MAEKIEEILPEHIAFIMDGNRRWAKKRMLPVKVGHKAGADALENLCKYANRRGIKYMTVYAFSTENWKRAEEEVNALMDLLKYYLDDYATWADDDNIRIRIIGDRTRFSDAIQSSIKKVEEGTSDNTGLTVQIALNYGGRLEITQAMQKIAEKVKNGEIEPQDITEEMITDNLYTAGIPDPDLMIRTSGEIRTSNFLPWQLTYSEFLFVDKLWPDFSEKDLDDAIIEYTKRNRKFGGK